MKFMFDTLYDQKGLTVMAKGLRKTLGKKKNKITVVFAIIVIIFAIPSKEISAGEIITLFFAILMIVAFIWQDSINAFFARSKMLKGANRATAEFNDDIYTCTTEIAKTDWKYENIKAIAENENYFVFFLSKNHGQLYDKRSIMGGTSEQFAQFIIDKTGLKIEKI